MTKLEMCYDGALVMPSNYAVMNEDEMTYVEGGSAKDIAKGIVIGAVATLVGSILKSAIKQSLVQAAINAAGAWVAGYIDSAIIAICLHPVATAVTVAGLVVVAGTVYAVGRSKGYW